MLHVWVFKDRREACKSGKSERRGNVQLRSGALLLQRCIGAGVGLLDAYFAPARLGTD